MSFDEIVAGPQLIGILFLISGWLWVIYPPKEINPMYGYRTQASMKTQETWDEANRFAPWLMVKYGAVLLLTGVFVEIAYGTDIIPRHIEAWLRPVLLIGLSILSAILLFRTTEKHLKKHFPNNTK